MRVFKGLFRFVQKIDNFVKKYCDYKLCFHKQELFQVSHSSRHYFRDQSPRQWQLCYPTRATKLIRIVWNIRKATLSYHIVSYLFSFCKIIEISLPMQYHTFRTSWQKRANKFCTIKIASNLTDIFSNFTCMFLNPNNFSNFNSNCSNLLDMRNLLEQVKKAFCHQKLF